MASKDTITVEIVIPITNTNSKYAQLFEHLKSSGVTVTQSWLATGTPNIDSYRDEVLAAPGILVNGINAVNNGAQALVIACVGDPGVDALREVTNVPVIGPGEAAIRKAGKLGKFSILAPDQGTVQHIANQVKTHDLIDKLATVHSMDLPVASIQESMEVTYKRVLIAALKAAEQDRPDAIILGCTGIKGITGQLAKDLMEEGHHIHVVDPMVEAVAVAVESVRNGTLPYDKQWYPAPHDKPITGFDLPTIN